MPVYEPLLRQLGGTVNGYFWLLKIIDPGLVYFYNVEASRGYHILRDIVAFFQEAVQCYGYDSYEELDKIKGIITIVCWVHA